MNNHQIPFGLDAKCKTISIMEAKRGLACGCFCAACCGELIANQGEINIWQFSHKSKAECFGALESALHVAVKALIEEHKSLYIPPCIVHSYPDNEGLERLADEARERQICILNDQKKSD